MSQEPFNTTLQSSIPAFIADSTLGKLAKWLRLAGFDTLYDRRPPNAQRFAASAAENRIILTRTHKVMHGLKAQGIVFIHDDQPKEQARQVVRALRLSPQDLHPLTRCARCNAVLHLLPRAEAQCLVPEYIWRNHCHFHQCCQCRRTYWPGTHTKRWLELMKLWFED